MILWPWIKEMTPILVLRPRLRFVAAYRFCGREIIVPLESCKKGKERQEFLVTKRNVQPRLSTMPHSMRIIFCSVLPGQEIDNLWQWHTSIVSPILPKKLEWICMVTVPIKSRWAHFFWNVICMIIYHSIRPILPQNNFVVRISETIIRAQYHSCITSRHRFQIIQLANIFAEKYLRPNTPYFAQQIGYPPLLGIYQDNIFIRY